MASQVNFTNCLKKTTTYPFQLFKKIEQEGMLPNSFNEIGIILLQRPDKNIKKDYRLISLININAKILN